MKQLTLSILLMLLPLLASAETVEIDGIWYNLVKKLKTAEVTHNPSNPVYIGSYSGVVTIPEIITYENIIYDVTNIGSYAFYNCYGLTSVTIPNSVTSIGEDTFYNCYGLTSITIPNSVTSIGTWAFEYCTGLTSITIPNSVTNMGNGAFASCSGLTSITIPNSLTSIGGAFQNCNGLTSVTIPNSVTSIGGGAFYNCTGLISITIPNSVTSIGGFYGCTSLSSITIPNSVTSIEGFSGCTSLSSITIPNSVTSIGSSAFQNCSGLTSITIGSGVKHIESAFSNCQELTDVTCQAELLTTSEWDGEGLYTSNNAFEGSLVEYATLHVPSSAINAYKTTAPWSGFGTIVTIEGGDTPETPKCAKPTITFENGKIKFSCETEGVEYISEITTADTKKYYDGEVTPTYKYNVSVYATKEGYENSDTATAEITATGKFGDMNHDNKITVADAVIIIDKVMKNEE